MSATTSRRERRAVSKGRCMRCRRRVRAGDPDFDSWNVMFHQGVVVGLLCPACQAPDEHLEAEVNEATTDYSVMRQDAFGRWVAGRKTA